MFSNIFKFRIHLYCHKDSDDSKVEKWKVKKRIWVDVSEYGVYGVVSQR